MRQAGAGFTVRSGLVVAVGVMIMVSVLIPLHSALAEAFQIVTTKKVYLSDDRVIVLGSLPEDAEAKSAVKISISGPGGKLCGTQTVSSFPDDSFLSRPFDISNCGAGAYLATATYSNLAVTYPFSVVSRGQQSQGTGVELQAIKQFLSESRIALGARISQLVQAGVSIPADVAGQYNFALVESSSALQAIEYGNASDAKAHEIKAIAGFRYVADSLPEVPKASAPQQSSVLAPQTKLDSQDTSNIQDSISRLQVYSDRLQKLAHSNNIDISKTINTVTLSLLSAQTKIASNDTASANKNLERLNEILENIRTSLYEQAQERSINSTLYGTRITNDDSTLTRLSQAADRIQSADRAILGDNMTNAKIKSLANGSLDLLQKARTDLQKGQYLLARDTLGAALQSMINARNALDVLRG